MDIYPPIDQRFSPFEFYSSMRKNNPVVYDDKNEQWDYIVIMILKKY
jgi:hypothetical protein